MEKSYIICCEGSFRLINNGVKEVNKILRKYSFGDMDREQFWKIIHPVFVNSNFQAIMSSKFSHHDGISLGYTIEAYYKCYFMFFGIF